MITFQNVTFAYPSVGKKVLSDMSFHIPLHGFQYLVGESGAGKTTILKLLLKEFDPQNGEIVVNGKELSGIHKKDIPRYRRKIGYVSEDMGLIETMTVYENVELVKRVIGSDRQSIRIQVAMALKTVGMAPFFQKLPGELSGGERMKVCIARAIVNHPDLLLADDPTANLDPGSSMEIMELFTRLHSQGVTLLVATHDRDVVRAFEHPQITIHKIP